MSGAEITMLRETLFDCLTEHCTSITRWYQPFFVWADAAEVLGVDDLGSLPKPYGVIVLGSDRGGLVSIGRHQTFEVWPYFEPGDFLPLDEAVSEIRRLLSGEIVIGDEYDGYGEYDEYDGYRIRCIYEGVGRDYYDTDLRAVTRTINFRTPFVFGG